MADKHMSRREMLRNAALVGVGAWAVPVLTSLPAHAATSKNPCKGIKNPTCGTFTQCGTCGPLGSAWCFPTLGKKGKLAKKTTCSDNFYCVDAVPCQGSLDCPKGQVCTTNTCCVGVNSCEPKCKGGSIRHGARVPARGQRTAAG